MFGIFVHIIRTIGHIVAIAGSSACIVWYFEEPECPKSLIK